MPNKGQFCPKIFSAVDYLRKLKAPQEIKRTKGNRTGGTGWGEATGGIGEGTLDWKKGHSVRGIWAALIAGVVHQCPTPAGVIRLLEENKAVREVCGFAKDKLPTDDALGRFPRKLVRPEKEVEGCFEGLVERLPQLFPGFGKKLIAGFLLCIISRCLPV